MKTKPILLTVVMALGLGPVLVLLAAATYASQSAREVALNPAGNAYEVNRDPQGLLWISEFGADEIWQVAPFSGVYTIYHGISSPSDARGDGAGAVWWADGGANRLGRLSLTTSQQTLWEVPGADGLLGTGIDPAGRFWATGFYAPLLFSFQLQTTQLCTYTLPSVFSSDYLAVNDEGVWLADGSGQHIFKLDPALDQLTQWTLPEAGYPEGLAVDNSGYLWWGDAVLGYLARLEPQLDRLITYTLPPGGVPEMIALSGNGVWFTDDGNSRVGKLDPKMALSSTLTITRSSNAVTPTCSILGPGVTTPITTTTGEVALVNNTYAVVTDTGGWTIYGLPDGGIPWGIAASDWNTWFVDYGRQVLGWLPFGVSVTACKYEDMDGDLDTLEDQFPVEGWPVYLTVDGERQQPGQLTKSGGCYTWLDLAPDYLYGLEEELPDGWTALTPSSHSFGLASSGEAYSFTFVNFEGQNVIYLPLVMR